MSLGKSFVLPGGKPLYDIAVADGKYRFLKFEHDCIIYVLRHGEPWWHVDSGSRSILALLQEIDTLKRQIDTLKSRQEDS